ncbi:MAG: signal peptidase I [Ruminococcaceae bacterium]|nr:signal peptidase I [Oscillospiraceae bacterium]
MNEQNKKGKLLSGFIDYVELFVIAICIVLILFSMVFRTCTVDGDSMKNTLTNGEVIIVSDAFYTPKRGDIVVFHMTDDSGNPNNNKPLVKRVIGVSGDTVEIDYQGNQQMTVTVTDNDGNVTELVEEYVYLDPQRNAIIGNSNGIFKVPEGQVFVLGDNRNNSKDSRMIGCIDERSILGKAIVRVSPISNFGFIG